MWLGFNAIIRDLRKWWVMPPASVGFCTVARTRRIFQQHLTIANVGMIRLTLVSELKLCAATGMVSAVGTEAGIAGHRGDVAIFAGDHAEAIGGFEEHRPCSESGGQRNTILRLGRRIHPLAIMKAGDAKRGSSSMRY